MIAAEQIVFEPAGHKYWLAGELTDSATQVLDGEGLSGSPWYTEASRRRGTAVHRIALLMSHGAHGSTPEEVVANSRWDPALTPNKALHPYGWACAKFYAKTGLKPLMVEQRLASLKWSLCGTTDLFGELPDRRTIVVDFKSGDPEDAAWIQVNLYAMMLEETFDIKPDLVTVVWLRPDGEFKMFPPRPPGGEELAIGCQAVNLYRWRRAHKKLGVTYL